MTAAPDHTESPPEPFSAAERLAEAMELMRELADDLEAEIEARRDGELPRRIERDLEPVHRAHAFLSCLGDTGGET